MRVYLFFPTAAETFVELDESQALVQLRLDKAEFGGKVIGVVGEDLQITGGAAGIAHLREARGIFRRSDKEFLLAAKLLRFAVSDQGV